MAKNNNLTDFLTDVANAIRSKKGTSAKINPQDFSSEIASIETGGGGGGESGNVKVLNIGDVTFYDYDGTILHSYSKDEFLALSEMPDLPSQEGLICQGWSYSFAYAKNYVAQYGIMDIGANYITDDGKTRLYIEIVDDAMLNITLYINQSSANGVTIDWGDGSATQKIGSSGNVNATHTYPGAGEYCITLDVASNSSLKLGYGSTSGIIFSPNSLQYRGLNNLLKKVEIGENMTSISSYVFRYCYSLKTITIPNGLTTIGTYAFDECRSLKCCIIPSSVTSMNTYVFNNCGSLKTLVIPSGSYGQNMCYNCVSLKRFTVTTNYTGLATKAFQNCYALEQLVIPESVKALAGSLIYNCYALKELTIPSGVTSLETYCIYNCIGLFSLKLPSKLTSIGNYAFYGSSSIVVYDFSECTTIPTNGGTNTFGSLPLGCKIIIPDALFDSWKSATNWNNLKLQDCYIKKSEWDALN